MEKRQKIGNIAIFAAVFILVNAGWHFYSWYSFTAPYGTVVASLALAICFFCYVDIKDALRDPVFYMMAATDIIALINLYLVNSHYGAILVVADFLLILYLANKIVFSKKEIVISTAFLGFFYFYWTFDVKGYFKGYNTNFGGLVLITGFIFTIILIEYVKRILKEKESKYYKFLFAFEIFMFAWGYNIIAWYRSRCALCGLLIMAILMLIPRKIWEKKTLYVIMCTLFTVGAIAFTGMYVALDALKEKFEIQIFYKDIMSGREEVWGELWGAYLKQPLTGIGSSYEIQVEWMEGLLEVHNGLLDMLIIHGLVVFIVVCVMLMFRLQLLRRNAIASPLGKAVMAGVMTVLITSFLENFMIVPPFSLILLILFGINNGIRGCE